MTGLCSCQPASRLYGELRWVDARLIGMNGRRFSADFLFLGGSLFKEGAPIGIGASIRPPMSYLTTPMRKRSGLEGIETATPNHNLFGDSPGVLS